RIVLCIPCHHHVSSILQHRALHLVFFFFFTATATTEIYTLSLHDALPISRRSRGRRPSRSEWESGSPPWRCPCTASESWMGLGRDRKSTRLNSSHVSISYAVFCLKKKKKKKKNS